MKCRLCGLAIVDVVGTNNMRIDGEVVTICNVCDIQLNNVIKAEVEEVVKELKTGIIKNFLTGDVNED